MTNLEYREAVKNDRTLWLNQDQLSIIRAFFSRNLHKTPTFKIGNILRWEVMPNGHLRAVRVRNMTSRLKALARRGFLVCETQAYLSRRGYANYYRWSKGPLCDLIQERGLLP